jgi:serine/threonine protein phosphatase PrpC
MSVAKDEDLGAPKEEAHMPPANAASPSAAAAFAFDMAAVSHPGTERNDNEDACVTHRESDQCGLVAVADGVSSYEGGEVASQRATEVVVRFFKEQGPGVATMKRLVRAVQQANIEIYDTAVVVPQLRTMCTTLTALVLDRGEALAAHVGDSRLYLIREGQILQLTKDHTVAAERASASLGLMSKERLRSHPDRCILTRSVGRELIVGVDRITRELVQDDVLIVCSDGLYNSLDESEFPRVVENLDAASGCRALIDAANSIGAFDNVTAAVVRITRASAKLEPLGGLGDRVRRWFR